MVTHLIRPLFAVLLGFSLLFQSYAVSADATPYPADLVYCAFLYGGVNGSIRSCVYLSQEPACRDHVLSYWNPIYITYAGFTYDEIGLFAFGACQTLEIATGKIYSTPHAWERLANCPSGGNADNFTMAQPICSCPAGYDFNPPDPVNGGPVCVPAPSAPSTCSIGAIPEYTPDPYPTLIDELSPRMQTALTCLQAAIRGQGGSSIFKSGYRPAPYNAHIQGVFDQRAKLRGKGPECAARKAELAIEEQRHDIGTKRPGDNSLHSIREAFDLKSSLSMDVTNGLAIVCNAFAPYPLTDRNHFEHTR